MLIGVPKEIKKDENRVGLLPSGVKTMVGAGHRVLVEPSAGSGCGHSDQEYLDAGAHLADADRIWAEAGMVYKVKEPQAQEWPRIRKGQILFTYYHFASSEAMTEALLQREMIALAFESIRDREGKLPCLVPMSEVAGRMSIQEGARCLEKVAGGRGVLLGGVPGVRPATVVVVGGGVVGTNAAKMAAGLGARVLIFDINLDRLRYLNDVMPANVTGLFATSEAIFDSLKDADLVVGAVLREGAPAPKLITEAMIKAMRPGSALVDVSIDQGGCAETSKATTHSEPTFVKHGVVHYCVANMPGGVATTSASALQNATLPYAVSIAGMGLRRAFEADPGLAYGLGLAHGELVHPEVAAWRGKKAVSWSDALAKEGI